MSDGKSATGADNTVTVTEVMDPVIVVKLIVLLGPSNAYDVLAAYACVLVIVPSIMPLPVRVPVIVTVLDPPNILPAVILMVAALMLLFKVTVVVAVLLFTVRMLKAAPPVMLVFAVPLNVMVLVDGVNVPLFIQLPLMVCVNVAALNVTPGLIVKLPLGKTAPSAVLVPPDANTRLW